MNASCNQDTHGLFCCFWHFTKPTSILYPFQTSILEFARKKISFYYFFSILLWRVFIVLSCITVHQCGKSLCVCASVHFVYLFVCLRVWVFACVYVCAQCKCLGSLILTRIGKPPPPTLNQIWCILASRGWQAVGFVSGNFWKYMEVSPSKDRIGKYNDKYMA